MNLAALVGRRERAIRLWRRSGLALAASIDDRVALARVDAKNPAELRRGFSGGCYRIDGQADFLDFGAVAAAEPTALTVALVAAATLASAISATCRAALFMLS